MPTRFYKVLRDLLSDPAKSWMLIVSIALGVFGIGTILGSYSVIQREMKDNYMNTVPASATIEVDSAISQELVDSIKSIQGIAEAERHASVVARMKVGEKWYPLLLFVIDDFEKKRTNKYEWISGVPYPALGSMLVERTAYGMMQAKEGDELLIKIANGIPQKIKLTGTVHDAGLAPAWQEQSGYGYISLASLHSLGVTQGFDQLRILVSEHNDSKTHIQEYAQKVANVLSSKGYEVHEIQVPPPGKHPHQGQMTTVMRIFIVFSFLILILGSILVATSISTIMVKQIRQIGVMKTIGANSTQIATLYFLMIVMVSTIALLMAVPLSRLAASSFNNQLAVLLNIEIRNSFIPNWVPLLQVVAGILIPILITSLPIVRGSRISVKKALDNTGVNPNSLNKNQWVIKFSQLSFLSEVTRLSIRNVFRQQARLLMTLGLLAAGGAMFMTAMNVAQAWNENLKLIYVQRLYDLEVRLNEPIDADSIVAKLKKLNGVATVEAWNYTSTSFSKNSKFEITRTYPDKGHGSFSMQAVPIGTSVLNPSVVEGTWLQSPMAREVVLNQSSRGSWQIGDSVKLTIDGNSIAWKIIGFTVDVGSPALAYVSFDAFGEVTKRPKKSKMLRIGYFDRSKQSAYAKNKEVESLLEKEKVAINTTIPVWLLHNAIAGHMKILINTLLAMAVLMALVGTLGLMSTMSMNILERTREIGTMRAIGATPATINKLIILEGMLIGSLSLIISFVLSLALSSYMGNKIGHLAFRTPLSLSISLTGVAIWIAIILIGSYIATWYPAKRANRITTREALAHE
ncbi:MAG: FtsX-like permease family protein [Cyclobacteriaceae bacterium]|nr:FtsX-like permease family protein [Cyclobacteriaceae bacterium]